MQVVRMKEVVPVKEYESSVSPKGQITIPIELRRLLGVNPKDKVVITADGDTLRVSVASADYVASYQSVPALSEHRTVEEMVEIAREEHAQEVAAEGLRRK